MRLAASTLRGQPTSPSQQLNPSIPRHLQHRTADTYIPRSIPFPPHRHQSRTPTPHPLHLLPTTRHPTYSPQPLHPNPQKSPNPLGVPETSPTHIHCLTSISVQLAGPTPRNPEKHIAGDAACTCTYIKKHTGHLHPRLPRLL